MVWSLTTSCNLKKKQVSSMKITTVRDTGTWPFQWKTLPTFTTWIWKCIILSTRRMKTQQLKSSPKCHQWEKEHQILQCYIHFPPKTSSWSRWKTHPTPNKRSQSESTISKLSCCPSTTSSPSLFTSNNRSTCSSTSITQASLNWH